MINKTKIFARKSASQQTARMIETIFRCKWSLTVFQLLQHGINRPGEMVRSVEGLSTKVLNDCLRRHIEFGILEKMIYNETPPRVEYLMTDYGQRFIDILDQISELESTGPKTETPSLD